MERNKRGVRAVPLDPKITIERHIIGTQEGCSMSMGIYIGKGCIRVQESESDISISDSPSLDVSA